MIARASHNREGEAAAGRCPCATQSASEAVGEREVMRKTCLCHMLFHPKYSLPASKKAQYYACRKGQMCAGEPSMTVPLSHPFGGYMHIKSSVRGEA